MDSTRRQQFFDVGDTDAYSDFARVDSWRTSVTYAYRRGYVDDDAVRRHIDYVTDAKKKDNIQNPEQLMDEVADNPRQISGQNGEAASAFRYADDGSEVELEPGNGDYDLAVDDGYTSKTYVEVKTRAGGNDIDADWVDSKLGSVNNKFDNADSKVSEDQSVLELRTQAPKSELDSAETAVNHAIDSYGGTIHAKEIRIVANDGTVRTVTI